MHVPAQKARRPRVRGLPAFTGDVDRTRFLTGMKSDVLTLRRSPSGLRSVHVPEAGQFEQIGEGVDQSFRLEACRPMRWIPVSQIGFSPATAAPTIWLRG